MNQSLKTVFRLGEFCIRLRHISFPFSFQVIDHIDNIEDREFLRLAFNALDNKVTAMDNRLKEKMLRIFLKCIVSDPCLQFGDRSQWDAYFSPGDRGKAFRMLCALGSDLKHTFPEHLKHSWQELCIFFNSVHLNGLVLFIDELVSEDELFNLVIQYFNGDFHHDDNCVDLFCHLAGSHSARQNAISCIVENYRNYSVNGLLRLAKYVDKDQDHSQPSGKIFSEEVFNIVLLAITRIKTHKCQDEHKVCLNFVFNVFKKEYSEITDRSQFQTLIDHLLRYCNADVLLSFCKTFRDCKPILETVKQQVGPTLAKKFCTKFTEKLKTCPSSEYTPVLTEMIGTRRYFHEFVPDADQAYKSMLHNVRRDTSYLQLVQRVMMEKLWSQLPNDSVYNNIQDTAVYHHFFN